MSLHRARLKNHTFALCSKNFPLALSGQQFSAKRFAIVGCHENVTQAAEVAAEVKANRTEKEKVVCIELSQLAETAALSIPLARFGKIVRAATNQKVGSSNLSGCTT